MILIILSILNSKLKYFSFLFLTYRIIIKNVYLSKDIRKGHKKGTKRAQMNKKIPKPLFIRDWGLKSDLDWIITQLPNPHRLKLVSMF